MVKMHYYISCIIFVLCNSFWGLFSAELPRSIDQNLVSCHFSAPTTNNTENNTDLRIQEFDVEKNHLEYENIKNFSKPIEWFKIILKTIFKTNSFYAGIIKKGYDSSENERDSSDRDQLLSRRFWVVKVIFFEKTIAEKYGEKIIVKIGHCPSKEFSEGIQLLYFQEKITDEEKFFFHPISHVFISPDLSIETTIQKNVELDTLHIIWSNHVNQIRQSYQYALLTDVFSLIGRTLANLHVLTSQHFQQDNRPDLKTLKCIVHGDLMPGNILIDIEKNTPRRMLFIDNISTASCLDFPGCPLQDIIYFLSIFFDSENSVYQKLLHKDNQHLYFDLTDAFLTNYRNEFLSRTSPEIFNHNAIFSKITDISRDFLNHMVYKNYGALRRWSMYFITINQRPPSRLPDGFFHSTAAS